MLGERIKSARLEKGLSQEELAQGLLSRSYICELERNKRRPSLATIGALAERLGKPLDYFLENEQQAVEARASIRIDQAYSLVGIGDMAGARKALREVQLVHKQLSVALRARYHDLYSWLEQEDGHAFSAVNHALLAESLYEELNLPLKQWYSLHGGAHASYLANLNAQAVELGQRALAIISRLPEQEREKRLTLNLLGNAYLGLGKAKLAEEHYNAALACRDENDLDTIIRLYHGKSICAEEQGNLAESLLWAEEASFLAKDRRDNELHAQCEVSRGLCLIRVNRHEEATRVLKEQLAKTTVSPRLVALGLTDYLLTLADQEDYPEELCRSLEERLHKVVSEVDLEDDYLKLKCRWAIAKNTLRGAAPQMIRPVIEDFAARFQRLLHHRHSADVLEYGAKLLEAHGDIAGALALLKAAVSLK
ncbi:MAG: helix-turn-helix transcriptional regulator [Firmicutes bacterium]|nr:helix-turn-helix transcriptional regulator [Dethiobacter sp.]MBS3888794.1 helix-turn-helix transcriptional regulator [Bacillota bacterium]MBS4054671.1 helix-turn-helix transcriptional regulator [Thermaerobacter sp.]